MCHPLRPPVSEDCIIIIPSRPPLHTPPPIFFSGFILGPLMSSDGRFLVFPPSNVRWILWASGADSVGVFAADGQVH